MQSIVIFLGKPNQDEKKLFPSEKYICFCVENDKTLFSILKHYSLQICIGLQLFRCAMFNNPTLETLIVAELNRIKQWAKTNIAFFLNSEKKYINNTFDNLTCSYKSINLLANKFNCPCIIVSAGPSLDKNIHLLNNKANKFIVICVGPVLKKLINLNIEVDFVVSIDPNVSNKKYFENLKKYPSLIFDSGIYHEIIKNYKGNKYISFIKNSITDEIKNIFGIDIIHTGMSVSHYAFNVASYMGCDPIIFIGQDLALTDGLSHVRDTLNAAKEETGELMIKGYYNNKVKTTHLLATYLDLFQEMFKKSNKNIYNCTEGGANIDFAKNKPLKEILIKFEECNMLSFIKELQNITDDKERITKIAKFLKTSLEEIESFEKDIEPYISQCNKIIFYINENKIYKAIEIFNNWKSGTPLFEKYEKIMEKIRHLILKIYLKKPYDIQQIKEAIRKKDEKEIKKFINEELDTFKTITSGLICLKYNYEKLKETNNKKLSSL
jgi:hypothetical protein